MKPVKPKIVSKDNSSPSAKEQIKLTKYGKVELTPLAKKLIVFAEEEKSVLLYGDYAGDLFVFMTGFHDVLHGVEPIFEYVGKKKMPMSFSPSEYLTKKMAKVISDRDHERIYELLRDFERTDNTYLEVDCNPDDGKTVFKVLTRDNHFTQEEFIDEMPPVMKKPRKHEMYPYWESFCTDIMANKDNFSKAFSNATSYRSQPLLERKGTLFVNNLTCNGSEDKRWFKALGKEIKKCKYSEGEWYISQTKRDGWLVVAIDDLDDFPQIFVDQFEQVPLDDSEARQQNKEINKEGVVVGPDEKKEVVCFPVPPDTKWTDVEITFIDNDHVNIKVKDVIKSGVHYSQVGFKHETAPKKIQLWDTLRVFALKNGLITPEHSDTGKLIKRVGTDDVKRLRKKLQICFGISDNPIPPYDKGKYTKKEDGDKEFIKGEGYKTSFAIKDDSGLI